MVLVAIEQGFPAGERILTDTLASPILPFSSRVWVRLSLPIRGWLVAATEKRVPGLWGGIMARKRFIDDTLIEAAAGPVEAVVNLGAGFDTRSFRLPELAEVRTWEVDQPGSIQAKSRRLKAIFGEVPDHATLVPVDFDRGNLDAALVDSGYSGSTKTIFILEGVTQYLTESGVRETFNFLSTAPTGSRLVFTYTPKDFITGRELFGQEVLYEKMRLKDTIWRTGFDPEAIDEFLGQYGWRIREHLGYDALGERYVKPTGRDLTWMAIERIVDAVKVQ
jgi:methyltransferase (TIGR00027 family)